MSTEPFDEPRLAINRVYTRTGDQGETGLAGGQRVPKDAARIEAYGTVDELNSFLGVARATVTEMSGTERATTDVTGMQTRLAILAAIMLRVQHELFNLGSILATLPQDVHPRQARVTDAEVARFEREMDRMNEDLPPLRSFVLPGGSRLNGELHVVRTVCRRAERACVALGRVESIPPEAVRYLNRLSDALFVWSRWASHITNAPETLWQPNQSTSGLDDG